MADRPTRADEVRTERRKKPGAVALSGLKLGVSEELLDRKTYQYRWANDKGNRIKQLHDEDWDKVSQPAAEDVTGVGTVQSKVVGTDDNGQPIAGVLMRKRKDWYETDQKEKQKPLDEIDETIRRGLKHSKEAPELSGGIGYTPNGQNQVSRG